MGSLLAILMFISEWSTPVTIDPPPTGTLHIFKPGEGVYTCGYVPIGEGLVMTAAHCLGPAPYIETAVQPWGTPEEDAVEVYSLVAHLEIDIAIARAPEAVSGSEVEVAAPVLGAKLCYKNYQQELKCTWAGVDLHGEMNDHFLLTRFYPESRPGDSGSPVFDKDGNLVGILSGRFTAGDREGLSIVARVDAFGVID